MIAIPVSGWVAIAIFVLGGLAWAYELLILKPRKRRQRNARKRGL